MSLRQNTFTSTNSQQIIFPYLKAHIDGHDIFYPRIVVTLDVFLGKQQYDFILDTGADITTLPYYMISMMKLDVSTLTESVSYGIGDGATKSWNTIIDMTIGKSSYRIPCSFVKNNGIPLLLGKEGVFDMLNIYLDNEKHETVLYDILRPSNIIQ